MAMQDIKAGDYVAKVTGGRFIQSATGKMALETSFTFKHEVEREGGKKEILTETITHQGWLSEAAIENTMKTLVDVLGYNGSEDVDAQGVLKDKKAFDTEKEIKLVIELQEGEEKDEASGQMVKTGKFYPRVKWVNSLGGSGYKGADVTIVKSNLQALGFKAAFLAAAKGGGKAAAPKTETVKQETFTADDIPF